MENGIRKLLSKHFSSFQIYKIISLKFYDISS